MDKLEDAQKRPARRGLVPVSIWFLVILGLILTLALFPLTLGMLILATILKVPAGWEQHVTPLDKSAQGHAIATIPALFAGAVGLWTFFYNVRLKQMQHLSEIESASELAQLSRQQEEQLEREKLQFQSDLRKEELSESAKLESERSTLTNMLAEKDRASRISLQQELFALEMTKKTIERRDLEYDEALRKLAADSLILRFDGVQTLTQLAQEGSYIGGKFGNTNFLGKCALRLSTCLMAWSDRPSLELVESRLQTLIETMIAKEATQDLNALISAIVSIQKNARRTLSGYIRNEHSVKYAEAVFAQELRTRLFSPPMLMSKVVEFVSESTEFKPSPPPNVSDVDFDNLNINTEVLRVMATSSCIRSYLMHSLVRLDVNSQFHLDIACDSAVIVGVRFSRVELFFKECVRTVFIDCQFSDCVIDAGAIRDSHFVSCRFTQSKFINRVQSRGFLSILYSDLRWCSFSGPLDTLSIIGGTAQHCAFDLHVSWCSAAGLHLFGCNIGLRRCIKIQIDKITVENTNFNMSRIGDFRVGSLICDQESEASLTQNVTVSALEGFEGDILGAPELFNQERIARLFKLGREVELQGLTPTWREFDHRYLRGNMSSLMIYRKMKVN